MVFQSLFALVVVASLIAPVFPSIASGSHPVCPTKVSTERGKNYPYVVYGTNPPQCYVASRQGPCSSDSVLFAQPRSHLGICSCKCFLSDGIVFDNSAVDSYRYCFDPEYGRTYVYDKSRGSCYRLGSQGPCPRGQILYKDIYSYDFNPKCVREDVSNESHTPIEPEEGKCPPGTIYSTLLNKCTDMNFHGLNKTQNGSSSNSGGDCSQNKPGTTTSTPTPPLPVGKCPPGTIYSTLLNKCTDMNFKGTSMGWGSSTGTGSSSASSGTGSTTNRCPPGTIYSTLLNICTDMNFKGTSGGWGSNTGGTGSNSNRCPPGTIYSTLLNICTDMNFKGTSGGWGSNTGSSSASSGAGSTTKCPPGTIYSTLLNICTDMNFKGTSGGWESNTGTGSTTNKCPPGTIYSTLLNKCTDMNFKGLQGSSSSGSGWTQRRCPEGTIYSTLLNRCTDMNFRGVEETKNQLL